MDFVKKTLNNVFGGVPSSPPPSSSSSIHASSNLSSSPNPSLKLSNVPMSGSSSLHSSPSSTNSNNFMYGGQPEDAHSLSNFKSSTTSYHHFTGAFLNFEKNDDYGNGTTWQESLHVQGYDQLHPKYASSNSRLSQEFNSGQSSSSYRSTMVIDTINEINPNGDQDFSLEANDATTRGEMCANKRPCKEESTQGLKRHCTTKVKQQQQQPKPKSNPAKDPQSVAAKNRRERISEKLKTLQELVPNGSKVDLVTMLDKAITYVKFLQLQMKVLATDEFWPAQGGKAPELSQIQEAIDAILSSSKHRNNNSSAS